MDMPNDNDEEINIPSDAPTSRSDADLPPDNSERASSDISEMESSDVIPEKDADEVYCTSCGDPIKEQAEVCPHCGVRQQTTPSAGSESGAPPAQQVNIPDGVDIPPGRAYELQKVARKDPVVAVFVSLIITPLGYVMVGKNGLALLNFFTLNFFFLGLIIVPIHVWKIIHDSRKELDRYGVGW